MGRGRQKAKQTKVARDLKYRSVETDFERLQRELRGEPYVPPVAAPEEELQVDDEYADYADRYADVVDAVDDDDDDDVEDDVDRPAS